MTASGEIVVVTCFADNLAIRSLIMRRHARTSGLASAADFCIRQSSSAKGQKPTYPSRLEQIDRLTNYRDRIVQAGYHEL